MNGCAFVPAYVYILFVDFKYCYAHVYVCLCGLHKELPRCLDVCIASGASLLITGTDGSCLKPCVSCNDSRVSVIISSAQPSLNTSSHSPTDSLHIHCHCSLAPLTSDWTYITHLNYIQILSQGTIAFSRMEFGSS